MAPFCEGCRYNFLTNSPTSYAPPTQQPGPQGGQGGYGFRRPHPGRRAARTARAAMASSAAAAPAPAPASARHAPRRPWSAGPGGFPGQPGPGGFPTSPAPALPVSPAPAASRHARSRSGRSARPAPQQQGGDDWTLNPPNAQPGPPPMAPAPPGPGPQALFEQPSPFPPQPQPLFEQQQPPQAPYDQQPGPYEQPQQSAPFEQQMPPQQQPGPDQQWNGGPGQGPAAPPQGPQPVVGNGWVVAIAPDREYFMAMMGRSGPEAAGLNLPSYSPEQVLPLANGQIAVGRRRNSTGEAPDIDLGSAPEDPGVSHQHALLVQQQDGSWAVVDQNSTNGTTINLAEDPIQPYVPVPLHEGDRVHVGAWTTLTVRRG
ncbi:FHA domain-containing protein [Streptomyces lydicus]|nr:FHA domain-containing protein [Streptomyces lydicus]